MRPQAARRLPDYLLNIASELLAGNVQGEAGEARIRRSVSSSYYALFHALCATVADAVVGMEVHESNADLWARAYRAPNHNPLRDALASAARVPGVSERVRSVNVRFTRLHQARQEADYDVLAILARPHAANLVSDATKGVAEVRNMTELDRAALVTHVLARKGR